MMSAREAGPDEIRQAVAAFLIMRPPVGFVGWGWENDDSKWDDVFLLQPGTPGGIGY